MAWRLWHAMNALRNPYSEGDQLQRADDFVKHIEIDEKFSKMQFILHSVKPYVDRNQQTRHMLEVSQLF